MHCGGKGGVRHGYININVFLGEKLLRRVQKAIKTINMMIFVKFLVSKTFLISQKLSKTDFNMKLLFNIWVGGTVYF